MSEQAIYDAARFYVSNHSENPDEPPVEIIGGLDSCVFRLGEVGEKVLKVYNGGPSGIPLSPAEIQFYMDVTNHASSYAVDHNLSIRLGDLQHLFPVRINPIDEMLWFDHFNLCVAISHYIPGPSAKDVFDPHHFLSYRDQNFPYIHNWPYPEECNSIVQFLVKHGVRDAHKIDLMFREHDNQLNAIFKLDGIYTGLENIKVLLDEEQETLEFMITDLCSSIQLLRKV